MKKINVGILVFNNIELLDFTGPYEVFSVTKDLSGNFLFNTFLIGKSDEILKSVNGLKYIPDYTIFDHPNLDILIIPGGIGTKEIMFDIQISNWIEQLFPKLFYIITVCTGVRILSSTKLMDNLEYTTHHDCFDELELISPHAKLNRNIRFTNNGKILTSGGISAGIDLSLHVVECYFGNEIKNKTIEYMEYGNWKNSLF
ncbi:DJ-1/PfpI family protein [Leptospira sp. 2 VSF19]|uniref:DJ-1/PfpI family protein n=1 Tax=Leptospira soteropolitanensis TaxID=2950025 RepID=A0AAW5VHH8_9LEPT|nr:DJ-1/PfpI family protein [Leptospira soteropolitanensis]MCW7494872.1 DJ-1/PfpI family protein [Leptospira soteropolitanensis]MCW7502240.1 DJ-1/PfpI family protein [Leptospira soteropolitanensis]MCW7524692.1 DJ-1/PfpI family protein [Leptospira soteropolitanensis]MCW7528562.1 DJ-1/PfpI family protein [Leptospira soteropolitanensis]MCW7532284.1 DJ-1/PfpI family protein [Leptospira soteropolitanensis]